MKHIIILGDGMADHPVERLGGKTLLQYANKPYMDINLELYKCFYYVATTLSFSEASRQLFISQSAVSQGIKTLEKCGRTPERP